MKKSRLEYAKFILAKVSFDINLFRKELTKALKNLIEEEKKELVEWVKQNYAQQYKFVLNYSEV
ncbi:MAG: hypothetical protein HND27_08270 [Bacteroidetes bacterium]|nr:hypothetical protein [Bacteroidota bacterium]MBV6461671.1 hypothetical protein [Flavobacteriales bacterium]WKZ74149.1 MAG: hypothetical protein QY303_08310 [Vicingaceae bacterium]MCL4816822.1 hypothetical protein [Flavobacteriales bacterium]NOG95760.1 hypothetical protein [Bacteroidota bacterium]